MSTIERALEKQKQLEEQKRRLQEREAKKQAEALAREEPATTAPSLTSEPTPEAAPSMELPPSGSDVTTEQTAEQTAEPTTSPQPSSKPADNQPDDSKPERIEIDINRLEHLGMVTPTETFTHIKEEYRYIKRPLLNNAFGPGAGTLRHPNLVMVSSSFSGEGKTFTTVNLAISMAIEKDRKVLLVDADVIKPHICERLGIEERPGLMDYLGGHAEVAEIIHDTNIDNLKLITAGRRHHHSNEMIASDKMKSFMVELSDRYPDRIVIFDTSPLLGASETNVLAQMTGQAVVVVEEERTTHAQLQQALSLLDPEMAIGLVLNKSKSRRREYYGYYYASSN